MPIKKKATVNSADFRSKDSSFSLSFLSSDPVIQKNRDLTISIMSKHGFKVNSSEWWHFDFIGWQKFDVLDISFEELEK